MNSYRLRTPAGVMIDAVFAVGPGVRSHGWRVSSFFAASASFVTPGGVLAGVAADGQHAVFAERTEQSDQRSVLLQKLWVAKLGDSQLRPVKSCGIVAPFCWLLTVRVRAFHQLPELTAAATDATLWRGPRLRLERFCVTSMYSPKISAPGVAEHRARLEREARLQLDAAGLVRSRATRSRRSSLT